jgi:hypothetical protein
MRAWFPLFLLLVGCPTDTPTDDDDSGAVSDDDDASTDDDDATGDDDDSSDDDDSVDPPTWADPVDAWLTITGVGIGERVAHIGDVDGDGAPDIALGVPDDPWEDETPAGEFGAVYVFFGETTAAPGTIDLDAADVVIRGDGSGDLIGNNVASAGDVDNDGAMDLLISGGVTENTYVFFATTLALGGELRAADADAVVNELVSEYVAGVGDVDDDGHGDLLLSNTLISAAGNVAGQSFLVSGATLTAGSVVSVDDAWAVFPGEAAYNASGGDIGPVGDVDGDGLADFAIAATGNSDGGANAGKLYVFFGASIVASGGGSTALTTADVIAVGLAPDDRLGSQIASLGDVDGDLRDDFAFSAPRHDQPEGDAGWVWVVSGAGLTTGDVLDLALPDFALFGAASGMAGSVVSGAQDADGDDLADLLIGNGARDEIWWVPAADLTTLGSVSSGHPFVAVAAGDQLGTAALSPGDVDGDGWDDVILGAPGAGEVYVIRSPFGD